MAEFVQLRFEDWGSVLAGMKKLKLFTKSERKDIVETINKLEFGIQKTTRDLDNVVEFASYVAQLIKTVEDKRQTYQVFDNVEEVEERMRTRMNGMFGSHTRNFYHQIEFWEAWLGFAIMQNQFDYAVHLYEKAIDRCGAQYPRLYDQATSYLFNLNPRKYINQARTILSRGMRLTKLVAFSLYSVRLELKYADYLLNKLEEGAMREQKRTEYLSEVQKCIELVQIILRRAVEQSDGDQLYTACLNELSKYNHVEFEDVKTNINALRVDHKGRKSFTVDEMQNGEDEDTDMPQSDETDIVPQRSTREAKIRNKKAKKNREDEMECENVRSLLDPENEKFSVTLFRAALQSTDLDLSCGKTSDAYASGVLKSISTNASSASKYLEYLHASGGIQEVRKFYPKLLCQTDYAVLMTLAKIEYRCLDHSLEASKKFHRFRDFMEKACLLHGKDKIDVWLNFIQHEKQLGNDDKASQIYERGLNTIKDDLRESLSLRYSEMQ